jgi:uncharacterized surface protein with fasciclin (FAS1) repeats
LNKQISQEYFMKMFNFSYRSKLLISAFTIASAISSTAVMAQMKSSVEKPVAEQSQMAANPSEQTIAEIASSSDSFKTLAAALKAADLVSVLEGKGSFTVFAPTDKAFAALPEGALEELLKPENKDILVQILTYHVVPETLMSADLKAGEVTTVEGSTVTIEVEDGVKVDQAEVVQADIKASNGVIHVIDKVIVPSN